MSSSARPARIRSGIGTELALSGSTGRARSRLGRRIVRAVRERARCLGRLRAPFRSCPTAARRSASDRSWPAARARRACGPGARAGCPPSRSSSRARRAAGSRSRRRSSAGRTCRRRGRCRTSRRSPRGRTTGAAPAGDATASTARNAATTTSTRSAPRIVLVVGGGDQGRSFRGVLPANCGEWCRVSRTALMPG